MDDSSNESFVWSDDLISKLIQLRYEKREEFKQCGKRGSTHDAWITYVLLDIEVNEGTGTSCIMFSKGSIQQLSLGVGHINVLEGPQRTVIRELHLENQVSVLTIRKKWNSLLNKFKDIENKIAIGSCSEDVAWPHYNQMQTIMNELSSQENPSILATGNNNETVKIQFSDMNNEGGENDDESQEQKLSKREKRDVIDERFIAAVEEGNEQLKAMNATLEKQGEAFLQLMSRLVNAMETQVSDDVSM